MVIRVLIVDDQTVVRRGVAQILADDPEIEVVCQAVSGRHVLKAVQTQPYDVLLLDIAIPEGSGLGVLEGLRYLKSRPHVLILSMYPEKQYALQALKHGMDGYLTKESLSEELQRLFTRLRTAVNTSTSLDRTIDAGISWLS